MTLGEEWTTIQCESWRCLKDLAAGIGRLVSHIIHFLLMSPPGELVALWGREELDQQYKSH